MLDSRLVVIGAGERRRGDLNRSEFCRKMVFGTTCNYLLLVSRKVKCGEFAWRQINKKSSYFWHQKSVRQWRRPLTKTFDRNISTQTSRYQTWQQLQIVEKSKLQLKTSSRAREFMYSCKLHLTLTSSLQSTCTRPLSSNFASSNASPWIAARCNWMSDGVSFCKTIINSPEMKCDLWMRHEHWTQQNPFKNLMNFQRFIIIYGLKMFERLIFGHIDFHKRIQEMR